MSEKWMSFEDFLIYWLIFMNFQGNQLAVGTHKGTCELWDTVANKRVSELGGHKTRIGSLAWHNDLLCSGSRDRVILMRDIRLVL